VSSAGSQLVAPEHAAEPTSRGQLAHLLHALNQPLTGLQCSLELAVAGPRRPEQHVQTLEEGLDLVARMRILLEAIRELCDVRPASPAINDHRSQICALEVLLRQTTSELGPVAETRKVHLEIASDEGLAVHADPSHLTEILFRFLESVLSLAHPESDLRLAAMRVWGAAILRVSWSEGPPLRHSPFSRPELGLMIAQARWEQLGAEWKLESEGNRRVCTIRQPLASAPLAGSGVSESRP
jgi:K+-sensing histidine kinase KdpD